MADLTTCCYQCAADRGELIGAGPIGFLPQVMFLCGDCGNKRCPRATNHRDDCSGSNAPGQLGSRYGGLARADLATTTHDEETTP